MKTLFAILTLAALTLGANAQKKQFSYVITANDTIYTTSVRFDAKNTRIESASGEKIKMANSEVNVWFINGVRYANLPVYKNNEQTSAKAIMKLVDCICSIEVYKHEKWNYSNECYDVAFNYYYKGKFAGMQVNPGLMEMAEFIATYHPAEELPTEMKPLVSK